MNDIRQTHIKLNCTVYTGLKHEVTCGNSNTQSSMIVVTNQRTLTVVLSKSIKDAEE